jgi:hypothetical protein
MEISKGGIIMYEVKAYRCSYCRKYGLSKQWIKKHEETCFHNPVTRSCSTCANFKKTTDKEGIFSIDIPVCLDGIQIYSKETKKWKLQSNCSNWVERPEDEEILYLYQSEKEKDMSKEIISNPFTDMPF